jgi:hypothetical protein
MANPANSSSGSDPAADAAAKANNALWYTFQGIGRAYLIKKNSSAATSARIAAVHGYPTIEQAQANPNIVNAASQLTITQWNDQASLPVGGGALGVLQTVNITAPSGGKPAQFSTPQNPTTAAASQATGLAAIGDFFNSLSFSGTWVRVAKVTVGSVLVIVGLIKMTGAEKVVETAAEVAK